MISAMQITLTKLATKNPTPFGVGFFLCMNIKIVSHKVPFLCYIPPVIVVL